jgi:hypothetical protein
VSAAGASHLERVADGRAAHRTALRRFDAVFGGPIWWAGHLAAMYWLVPRVCQLGSGWPLHLVTLIFAALCARAGLSALQILRAGRAAGADHDLTADRDVYLGWLGLLLASIFGAVTVLEWVPSLVLDACL